jgi:putative ABC transport system substrate-binding protein
MPELAREAIATKPDVVIAVSTVAILAVKEASSTVPIVMSFIGEDPIAKGLAVSLARPGGSATGVAMMAAQLDGKRTGLLHEFVPAARRIAILTGRPPRHAEGAEEAQRVARELGLETDVFYADEPADYVAAFAGMRTARSEALVIISAPDFFRDAALLSRLALEAGLPTVCEWASMARDGCLIGYGPNFAALWRRPAEYVAQILRGAKPGELPIEQPTLFEFAINLKTAKACPGALHQRRFEPGSTLAQAIGSTLAGTLVVARTYASPRDEMCVRREPAHVDSDLGDDDVGAEVLDARDRHY